MVEMLGSPVLTLLFVAQVRIQFVLFARHQSISVTIRGLLTIFACFFTPIYQVLLLTPTDFPVEQNS